MKKKTDKKYSPPRSAYQSFCSQPGCNEITVTCKCILDDGKPCGQVGHPDFWKHDEQNMVPVVQHGHFLIDKDKGRNVNHKVGEPRYCPAPMRKYTWRMFKGKERWMSIPRGQKKAMGWDY